jgi:hypothetical protein
MDGDTVILQRIVPLIVSIIAIILRAFGALGIGLVGGSVLRRSVLREASVRFHTPLIFLATALLAATITFGTWSSPGTLALFGVGLFAGYMFLERRTTPTVIEGEVVDVDVHEEVSEQI